MNKKEQLKEFAANIGEVHHALCTEGFTADQATSIVCSMLSSSTIYMPFADISKRPDTVSLQ